MANANPSILSHISIGTNRFDEAAAFYDKVLASIGAKRIMQHDSAIAFGRQYPEFWLQTPFNDEKAETANGIHIAFFAGSRDEVDAFHKAAVEAGGTDDGAPGPRPEYGEPFYGCFVHDLDGHKIEATFWDMELAQKLGMG